MHNLTFEKETREIYEACPKKSECSVAENELFKLLYTTFCERTHSTTTFEQVCKSGLSEYACSKLFDWYKKRYVLLFQMLPGKKGQQRNVTIRDTYSDRELSDVYHFNSAYIDNRAFKKYLIPTKKIPECNQDFFAFIMHTAVAFMVPPAKLDFVLKYYGFQQLHVKNIHHLAIYAVLTECLQFGSEVPASYNPFDVVRDLYGAARQILNDKTDVLSEISTKDYPTALMRENLIGKQLLTRNNFLNIVKRDKAAFTMRHSQILADHHKFAVLYTVIFDQHQSIGDFGEVFGLPWWMDEEVGYSLFSFVEQHCKSFDRYSRFTDQLFKKVDVEQKHPTRELMILFWLYSHCFRFTEGVPISEKTYDKLLKELGKYSAQWESDAKQFYREGYFDVGGFVSREPFRKVDSVFRGSNFIAEINSKLDERYGWRPLNSKFKFDYYILQLNHLTVKMYDTNNYQNAYEIEFQGEYYASRSKPYAGKKDIPCPLVVFDEILRSVAACSDAPIKYFPLSCDLYEQI